MSPLHEPARYEIRYRHFCRVGEIVDALRRRMQEAA